MLPPDLQFNRGDRLRLKEEWWPANAGAVARVIKEHWQPDGHCYYIIEWDNPEANHMGVKTTTVYQHDEGRFEMVEEGDKR